jgi:hypothetical protein
MVDLTNCFAELHHFYSASAPERQNYAVPTNFSWLQERIIQKLKHFEAALAPAIEIDATPPLVPAPQHNFKKPSV